MLNVPKDVLFADLCLFAKAQLASRDIDPMYWLLRDLYKQEGIDLEQRIWRTFLYVVWYHIGSAKALRLSDLKRGVYDR